MNKTIEIIEKSIQLAELGESQLTKEILELPGMSSPKVRHFLNNLLHLHENTNYLEVGIWKGSTFISANYNNETNKSIAVDNFSEFLSGEEAADMLDISWNNIKTYLGHNKSLLINNDFKNIDYSEFDKFNVYFYDGAHTESDQYNAFIYLNPFLEDRFICIVDDWNDRNAKEGTRMAFEDLGYNVLWETELPADYNGDMKNWWNGLYVAYISKPLVTEYIAGYRYLFKRNTPEHYDVRCIRILEITDTSICYEFVPSMLGKTKWVLKKDITDELGRCIEVLPEPAPLISIENVSDLEEIKKKMRRADISAI